MYYIQCMYVLRCQLGRLLQGMEGVSPFQFPGEVPPLPAGAGPLPKQRLGECRVCDGDVCRGRQELCTADRTAFEECGIK